MEGQARADFPLVSRPLELGPHADKGIDPLRNYDEFSKSLRNFSSWLSGVVSGASDLDLLIERRGRFFVAELKPWQNGIRLPYGQHLALKSLAELPQFDVYLVGEAKAGLYLMPYGSMDAPNASRGSGGYAVYWPAAAFKRVTVARLRSMVKRWWDASSN